ncbi:sigma-54-dependent Fis family transcriptional regulator [Streptomyces sp. NPDC051677]|uniref:sigma-54-dependent Fis family transcriptional regulator n=1 Tax=Streptomyces sp. NPDC051677 TaxID=3365669 RepID=UPI0037D16710
MPGSDQVHVSYIETVRRRRSRYLAFTSMMQGKRRERWRGIPVAHSEATVIALRQERERMLGDPSTLHAQPGEDHQDIAHVRADIVSSWRRSHLVGVAPSGVEVPYNPEFDRPSRLIRAAAPVLDRLAEQLLGGPAAIILADSEAQILGRRAGGRELFNALDRAQVAPGFRYAEEYTGTNGIGSALEERRPFMVQGSEHFRDNLQEFTCIGSPLVHPVSRTVEGVLDVTCRFDDTNVLMKPLVLSAVREIESRMYADASLRERLLLEHFLGMSRKTHSAVVSLNENFIISNTAASKLLDASDQALLWDWARRMLTGRDECTGEIRLARDIVVQARATKVVEGGHLAGVLVEMRVRPSSSVCVGVPTPRVRRGPGTRAPSTVSTTLPGRSVAWDRLRRELDAVVDSRPPVLMSGEPGTGKLFLAQYVHQQKAGGETLTVLDAFTAQQDPDAWLERLESGMAMTGTLVVRHIDSLPTALVPRMGGLLEDTAAFRACLVATTRGRGEASASARLLDHFPVSVTVPPLRYRTEDIADIAPVLIRRHTPGPSCPRLQPGALQTLMGLDWPGNVRELEAVLTTALMRSLGSDISQVHLPPEYRFSPTRHRMAALERAERDTILQALADTGGNKLAAAERLGIARSTLYRKMRVLGIDDNRFGG